MPGIASYPAIAARVTPQDLKPLVALTVFVLGAHALWTLPEGLSMEGRKVLIVTLGAVLGWVGTRLPESLVAIAAALSLVLWGAIPEQAFFGTLGSDLVWLLLAAFLIAAVLKESGLVGTLTAPLVRTGPRVVTLFAVLTTVIAATAFILPSTSARAALLLPVFTALLPVLPHHHLGRALALLFPSVILLSAGSSLIGAGAHIVAVDAIANTTGLRLGYADWFLLGAPLGFLASAAAAALILAMFVPRVLWQARVRPIARTEPRTRRQRTVLAVLLVLVALWMTEALHGISITIVAVMGALVLLLPLFATRKTKEVFRSVDTELLVYLAATMLLAQAMTTSGADRWLADGALAVLPPSMATHGTGIAIALSLIAVAAHLAIASRSARAAVLIPAVALPAAGLGHDAALTVLIVTMGTGFCQTLMASAKPVAIYGTHEGAGFSARDLLRLALPLAPLKILLLVAFATWVWPAQLDALRGGAGQPAETPAQWMQRVTGTQALAARQEPGNWQAAQSMAPERSLRPVPRPYAVAPPAARASAPRDVASPRPGTRIERDLREAGRDLRQAGRDLRQAGRDLRRTIGSLF